ncbi:MAG: hypothetical protein IJV36_01495 [Prevotella sp.]|nr:hypothetical protein [Prevotella sp.]
MKNFIAGAGLLFLGLLMGSCNGGKISNLTSERDSVAYENQRLNEFLDIVAFSMDSINGQERYLYLDKEGKPLSNKEQIRNNLKLFKYTLDEQRKRIAELEQELQKSDNERSRKLRSIIASLQSQLDEKDAMIAELQSELDQKNADISVLRTRVDNLTANVTTLSGQVDELNELNQEKEANLQAANKEVTDMSIGYVIVGTKSQLSAAGVLKGGFLKKKKVDLNDASNGNFNRIDIRSCNKIDIPGKNAKVLSSQPKSSYVIEEGHESSVLRITNSSQFWEGSRYLIVQYK